MRVRIYHIVLYLYFYILSNEMHLIVWPYFSAVKCKVFPVHAVKAYRGIRSVTPLRLNLTTRWKRVVVLHFGCLTPGTEPGTHWIGGWVGPRVNLDFWKGKKYLFLARNEILDRPSHRLVTILATLSRVKFLHLFPRINIKFLCLPTCSAACTNYLDRSLYTDIALLLRSDCFLRNLFETIIYPPLNGTKPDILTVSWNKQQKTSQSSN
jgi:hypothetical protein